jgi:hypothetical protein
MDKERKIDELKATSIVTLDVIMFNILQDRKYFDTKECQKLMNKYFVCINKINKLKKP